MSDESINSICGEGQTVRISGLNVHLLSRRLASTVRRPATRRRRTPSVQYLSRFAVCSSNALADSVQVRADEDVRASKCLIRKCPFPTLVLVSQRLERSNRATVTAGILSKP